MVGSQSQSKHVYDHLIYVTQKGRNNTAVSVGASCHPRDPRFAGLNPAEFLFSGHRNPIIWNKITPLYTLKEPIYDK